MLCYSTSAKKRNIVIVFVGKNKLDFLEFHRDNENGYVVNLNFLQHSNLHRKDSITEIPVTQREL